MTTDRVIVEDKKIALQDCLEAHTYRHCTIDAGSERVHLADVFFEHCDFVGDFTNNELFDCQLTHCNLANIDWHKSVFSGVRFDSCRMTGALMDTCRFVQCELRAVGGQMLNCAESEFSQCHITDSDLTDSSFQAARCKEGLAFPDCVLTGADFTAINLKNWDFSAARFDSLSFDPQRLRGVKLASWQAPVILALLGVQLEA
jgi:uncharacterized protein YjbI with pentapeptide repeats